ncbi:NAD-dependent epimerase/dehydratase family protein [Flavobacterium lacus]|uniref:UDP-glucose 4-epimerase n=1 Tax=Flavobacterium lacus TaxID=1353778 RepID=A0A328WTS2_9FLAO|nr:NAD-dependent epimerase/dehydratase family protein [Flavobacterium lacus]RAR47244.1 UDP-glucose 4-epimerase [Flavobacterium lacus]
MILVTGAAGFIGSKVTKQFIAAGYKTITIDNLSTGLLENIPKDTIFIEGSCGNKSTIEKLNDYPIAGIIHIAGQSSGEVSFEDPQYDLESNTLSTLLLLDFAKKRNIKRFVFASTMSVYGDVSKLPVEESTIPEPKSFYACGKLASESYLRVYAGLGIETYSLRLFNVYGPGQNLENLKQGMLSIYLAQALHNDEIIVKGSGDRFRDFVYIDDVVEAFKIAYFNSYQGFDIFNVCNGYPITVDSMIAKIFKNLNYTKPVTFSNNTLGDQNGIYGSNEKIMTNLGWIPKVNFEDGLQSMIEWGLSK